MDFFFLYTALEFFNTLYGRPLILTLPIYNLAAKAMDTNLMRYAAIIARSGHI